MIWHSSNDSCYNSLTNTAKKSHNLHLLCKKMTNLLYNAHRNLTRQDLVDYINSHYKAPRMVLAAAGGRCSSSYAVRTHYGAL